MSHIKYNHTCFFKRGAYAFQSVCRSLSTFGYNKAVRSPSTAIDRQFGIDFVRRYAEDECGSTAIKVGDVSVSRR